MAIFGGEKIEDFQNIDPAHSISTLVRWVFYAFFCNGTQLHRVLLKISIGLAKVDFVVFEVHSLLLTVQFYVKVNVLQMQKNKFSLT